MRKLVIVRGAQGSGKSRLVSILGLEGHHLSYDKGREFACGDVFELDGAMRLSQEQNRLVYALTRESLARRLSDGETIVFEATMPTSKDVRTLVDQARAERYEVLVVDFYGMPLEVCLESNRQRPRRLQVPDHAIERAYQEYADQPPLEGIETIVVESRDDLVLACDQIHTFLERGTECVDLSKWDRVIHVGDLQGTLHTVLSPESPLADGIPDDAFVIFTGDLFDRGVENGEVARWFIDHVAGRPNAVLIAGNHEDHVEKEADGRPSVSSEWSLRTMPQLRAAGITRQDLKTIADATVPFLHYVWRGQEVLCTHGGLSGMPKRFELISVRTFRKGNGQYGHGIDAMWTQSQAESGIVQVHGHRNSRILPVITSPEGLSINLEGQVEFGGNMRFAVLSSDGWTPIEVRSTRYRTMVEARMIDEADERQPHGDAAPLTPWMREGRNTLDPIRPETKAAFDDHGMIAVHQSPSMPHVSSVNFTKQAFWSKGWDAFTTVARGLFVDNVDDTIVARSYPKFWNHGERHETSDEGLQANLQFPIDCFEKANGFLCVTGYSERTGKLIVASKSRVEGPFAEWAQEIVAEKLGPAGMERMLRFNRDQHASLVFEVIDPFRDPHIIEYSETGIVLLGCVRRSEEFEQMDYVTLQKLAKWLGCPVKQRIYHGVKGWVALQAIMERAENDPSWLANAPIEGLVIQDHAGYQYKVKASFYRDWKRMRGAVERIALSRRSGKTFDRERYADMPSFQAFLDWAESLNDEALGLGIIALRNMYFDDPEAAAAMVAPPMAAKPKDMTGFLKGVDAIAAQVAGGTAKKETVRKLLASAEADPDKRPAIAAHPSFEALRAYAD
jgi:predicted kinase